MARKIFSSRALNAGVHTFLVGAAALGGGYLLGRLMRGGAEPTSPARLSLVPLETTKTLPTWAL